MQDPIFATCLTEVHKSIVRIGSSFGNQMKEKLYDRFLAKSTMVANLWGFFWVNVNSHVEPIDSNIHIYERHWYSTHILLMV